MQRHADWWHQRGSLLFVSTESGPLSSLWLPLADGSLANGDLDLTPEMLDLERMAGPVEQPGPLGSVGDGLDVHMPYGAIPWVEAILGCPIHATYQSGSMRSAHIVRDWDDWKSAHKWTESWAESLFRLSELLVAHSGGRYAFSQTLMRGPSDLAEAVLGPEFMCLSMYDHPRELRAFLEDVTEVFLRVLRGQWERVPRVEGGCTTWWGLWAPGTVVRTQCDASAILSARQYAEWFLPYDVRICEAVDYSVIHLHSGSLHTVGELLKVPKPQAIQVSLDPEPSGPPYLTLLPTFERILRGGKSLIINGTITREELRITEERLPSDGRYIGVHSPWTFR
jgi:hypothetical protein